MKNLFTLVSVERGCELAEGVDRQAMLKSYRAGEAQGVTFRATVFGTGPNRNHILLNEDELSQFAASFKGQPFLMDHERSQSARGGTILESQLEEVEGRKVIRQKIAAVKPFAVEGVLDGTIDRFSIGWNAEQYICTVCGTDFLDEDEKHTPWDIGMKDRKSGKTVEVLMKGLSGAETSAVTHPAVMGTGMDDVLAQLKQLSEASGRPSKPTRGLTQPKEDTMKERLLTLLGLAADTAESEALKALEARLSALRPLPGGLLSALGLGAEATDDEAIAAVHKLHATTVPRADFDRISKELGTIRADGLVRKYEDERKITPAMRDWARGLAESNPAEFERVMKDFPVQTPAPMAPPPPSGTPSVSSDENEQMAASGLTTDEWNRAKARIAGQRGKGGN